jgi:hypothetical protein
MTTAQNFKTSLLHKAPQAQDDHLTGYEDEVKYIDIAQLLVNDLGSAAKSFYSLNQNDPKFASIGGSTAITSYAFRIEALV